MSNKHIKILISGLLLTLITSCATQPVTDCAKWKTTGFYTPIASDFALTLNKSVKVEKFKTLSFNDGFIKAVKIEGWGRTRFGWYLGYYGGRWHKSKTALNSLGRPLVIGEVAVDNAIIAKGQIINIPMAQKLLGVDEFVANDVGSAIKKRHIDIYTGEGHQAKLLSYKVTGQYMVCTGASNLAPVIELSQNQ